MFQALLGALIKHIVDYNKALDLTLDLQAMITKSIAKEDSKDHVKS